MARSSTSLVLGSPLLSSGKMNVPGTATGSAAGEMFGVSDPG